MSDNPFADLITELQTPRTPHGPSPKSVLQQRIDFKDARRRQQVAQLKQGMVDSITKIARRRFWSATDLTAAGELVNYLTSVDPTSLATWPRQDVRNTVDGVYRKHLGQTTDLPADYTQGQRDIAAKQARKLTTVS